MSFLVERRSATGIILKQERERERLQPATFPRSRHWHARNNVIIIMAFIVIIIIIITVIIMTTFMISLYMKYG